VNPLRSNYTKIVAVSTPLDMKYSLLSALLFLTAQNVTAQDSPSSSADSLRQAGDFPAAVSAYRTLLASTNDPGDVAYSLATTFALSGQYSDSAFVYLERAMETHARVDILYDADLYFLIDDPRWASLEERLLNQLSVDVGDGFDREYARALLAARINEWGYRWHIMFAFRTLGPESPILTALAHAMQSNHEENEARVLHLVDQKGWPRLSAVGEKAAFAASNVLTHADTATRLKYLPLVEAACQAGESEWSEYAPILDRTELELGRPQVYGTQMEKNQATGLFEPQPMIDPDRVDQRRAEKGMEPLSAQLERFNSAMKRDFGG
jgi:hypothetical protein